MNNHNFIQKVEHDLRNHLAVIKLSLEVMASGPLSADQRRAHGEALAALERLTTQLHNLRLEAETNQ